MATATRTVKRQQKGCYVFQERIVDSREGAPVPLEISLISVAKNIANTSSIVEMKFSFFIGRNLI